MTVPPRVIHFSTVHPPSDVRIYEKQCRSLAENGWRVDLVTVAGDRAPVQLTSLNNVAHVRIDQPRGRLGRMTISALAMLRYLNSKQADIYHFHDPELLPVAIILRLTGKTVIYDAHESTASAVLTRHWIPRPLRATVAALVNVAEFLAGYAMSAVVAATPHIATRFPRKKCCVVQNYPITTTSEHDPLCDTCLRSRDRRIATDSIPRLIYVGWISLDRGIEEVLQALVIVNKETPLRLTLVGGFHANIADRLKSALGWTYVDFLGWQPRCCVRSLMREAVAGVVTFHPAPNHLKAQPNKLFEYMEAGLPVIASNFHTWRTVLNDCGRLVDPTSATEIAAAMSAIIKNTDLWRDRGERAKATVDQLYSWQTEFATLLQLYRQLSERP